ncbi:MAG: ABC transporter ATP-binding protein [Acidimicrobiia bacterium]|nr:ABC transporter ATP-binding protein [Acidimicrobiia bacterium]
MLLHLLRTQLRPARGLLVAVLVLQTAQAMATLTLPSLAAEVIDRGVIAGDQGVIWSMGSVMLVVAFAGVVANIAAVWFGARVAMGLGRDTRSALFGRISGFSAREIDELGAPSLITRTTNDVQQVQMFVFMSATLLIAAPITGIGGVIMAVRQDAGLSWVLAIAVPVLAGAVGVVVVLMVPQFRRMQERIDAVNAVLREQLTGIRVVRAFVREPAERARFDRVNDDLTDTALRAGHLQAFLFPIVMAVLQLSSVVVIWFGAGRIDAGELQVGALIAFLTYLVQILIAVMMATFMAVMAPRASVAAERIGEVLATESSVVRAAEPITELDERLGVELRQVSFRYPRAEEPVVCDVDLVARPGTTTAIIGSTGSGKTTLVQLIPRLYDATGGSVTVGGVDVADLEPEVLWGHIGYVPQKPFLFTGTVRSNLAFGAPDATEGDLWEALEVAQAADFVAAMPEGLDAPIRQGGTNVSGGQRQRLAIARAIVRRPPVLIFDDSFSALDVTTDARLRAALANHITDAAVVVVAQRVSSIMAADQILVLEEGRTVGLGTHGELLETCPTYAEIVDSQLRGAGAT